MVTSKLRDFIHSLSVLRKKSAIFAVIVMFKSKSLLILENWMVELELNMYISNFLKLAFLKANGHRYPEYV
ncbi:hypothetical protein BpHYR1_013663 [Brachionus plicatilis]|uniref:Uncharacterized protein n=1 Tax=Brachionus plicatilis TaxID=10195 RepID=A0A3M7SXM7_BRAPC|nr:hypothetical protein BpHYR1_013663 [Brachionus plicatilis]